MDPFSGEPGTAPHRIFIRHDGTVDIKANDKDHFADLKVRVSVISDDLVDVFNSVNGKATATDGSEYKVRAWADLIVEDGVPQGDPEDFVGFKMTEIKRCIEPGPEEGVAVASERLRCRRPLNPQEGEARIR